MQYLIESLIFLTSLFLILLVLIQRGRGGGLAGALGGMGGQSAFGTKAGDLFTRITIGVAAFWILLSVAAIAMLNQSHSVFGEGGTGSVFSGDAPADATDSGGGAAGTATVLPKSDGDPVGSGATDSGIAPASSAPTSSNSPPSTPVESPPASESAPAPATPEKE